MAILRLRYVHTFVDRHGKPRYYFRRAGRRWPLPGLPGTAEFTATYDKLLVESTAASKDSITFGPHTIGYVIERYVASDVYTRKARNTRRAYRPVLDRLKGLIGRGLIADLREDHVRKIRTHFVRSSIADRAVMLISMVWVFAKENLAMPLGANPAADIRRLHQQAREHEPWPEAVIEKFYAEAPQPNAQLALLLLLYTGQRVGDVAAMCWSHYDGMGISVCQEKTNERLWVPCHSRLKAALDSVERGGGCILTTRHRKGYRPDSLGNLIKEGLSAIGCPGYSAHGLRKNAAIALAECGCSVHQIMAVTGHRTYRMALHYT